MMEGIEAVRLHREGKITLRTHVFVDVKPMPRVAAKLIRKIRESCRAGCSRS